MGAWGWDEVEDYVRVEGTVYGPRMGTDPDLYPRRYTGVAGDWDWLVFVRPDPGFGYVLENPLRERNTNGLIECEVQPKRKLPNREDARDWAVVQRYFGPMRDQHVTAIGTWSRDRSHSFRGESIYDPRDCEHGKMELHPVSAILREVPQVPGTGIRRFVLLAFADDAGDDNLRVSNRVPHTGENRSISLTVPVPDGSVARKVDEVADAAYASCSVIREPGPGGAQVTALRFSVETGRPRRWPWPGRDQGFYYGVWDAYTPSQVAPSMRVAYAPDPLPCDVRLAVTVTAADVAGGAELPGSPVFLDGVPAGVTGTPITYRFTSVTKNKVIIGGRGNPIEFQVRVPPTVRMEVQREGYRPAIVLLRFSMPSP